MQSTPTTIHHGNGTPRRSHLRAEARDRRLDYLPESDPTSPCRGIPIRHAAAGDPACITQPADIWAPGHHRTPNRFGSEDQSMPDYGPSWYADTITWQGKVRVSTLESYEFRDCSICFVLWSHVPIRPGIVRAPAQGSTAHPAFPDNYRSVTRSSSPSSRKAFCVSSRDCFESPSDGLTSTAMVSFRP